MSIDELLDLKDSVSFQAANHDLVNHICEMIKENIDFKVLSQQDEEKRKKLKEIADAYGNDPQIDMCIEECSELIKALLKYRRKSNSNSSTGEEMSALREDIIGELADVRIMVEQMEIIFGCHDKVKQVIDYKISRQMKRLENHNPKM